MSSIFLAAPIACVLFVAQAAPEISVVDPAHDELTQAGASLRPAALAREAYAAAREAPLGEHVVATVFAIRALRDVSLDSEADQATLSLVEATSKRTIAYRSNDLELVVGLLQHVRGFGAAIDYADLITDPRAQDRALVGVLERAAARGEWKLDAGTLALASHGLSPDPDPRTLARMGELWFRAGDATRGEQYASRAYQKSLIDTNFFAGGDVTSTFVHGALARGDTNRARSWIERHAQLHGDDPFTLMDVGEDALAILRAELSAGKIEEARLLAASIEWPASRVEALTLVATELWKAGRAEAGDSTFQEAHRTARETGTPDLCTLALALQRAGRLERARELVDEATSALSRAEKSQLDAFRRALAVAHARTGRFGEAETIVRALPTTGAENVRVRDEALRELFVEAWSVGRVGEALELLDLVSSTQTACRAIRDTATRLAEVRRPERERLRLASALSERCRRASVGDQAQALAALASSGLTKPAAEEDAHPWSLPPALPGTWTTLSPTETARFAQTLAGQLSTAGSPVPTVRAARVHELTCYADGRVVEIDGLLNGIPHVHTLLVVGERAVRIGGHAREWNELNDVTPPALETDAQAVEYARLFATMIGDVDRRFRVVSSLEEVTALARSSARFGDLPIRAPRVLARTPEFVRIEATLAIGRGLVTAQLDVTPAGRVQLHDDRRLVADLEVDEEWMSDSTAGGYRRADPAVERNLARLETEEGPAAYEIGLAFATGHGRDGWGADFERARVWLDRAERAGRAGAYADVARALAAGRVVPHDEELALAWWRLAGERGDADAAHEMGRTLVASGSPARVRAGLEHLRAGERAGHAGATYELARVTHDGIGTLPADPAAGRALYEKAFERGSGPAALQLGLIHADAIGIPARDAATAGIWFARARERGVPVATYLLGILRANGLADSKFGDAEALYVEAATAGVQAANVVLALRARTAAAAQKRPIDPRALEWSRTASAAGHRYGALVEAMLACEGASGAPDLLAARVAEARAKTLGAPAPLLRSFVDPCYLAGAPAGVPVDAAAILVSWHADFSKALAARLAAR